jgi:tetratricopeptide (TPR) repeat protein
MADADRCPNCGDLRPANAPEGLCPRCLLHFALGETPSPGATGPGLESTDRDAKATKAQKLWPADTTCDRTVADGAATVDAHDSALATALLRGATLRYFGDYEIRKELGRGGMGVVFEARQVSLNRPVALKMIKAGVLADFGLAKRVEGGSELTTSGAILGTPAYMAPEQASGRRGGVTTQTDVYGLGAILYALLTGHAPFSGTTVLDTLEYVRERPPESPRKHNPRVPRDLEVICLKCLEKDPRSRYASAEALAEDLRRFQASEPIAARRVGGATRLFMWCRRNPVSAAAIGLAATVLLVTVAAAFIEGARRQEAFARKEAETDFARAQKAVDDYLTNVSENTLLSVQDSVDMRGLRRDLLKSALGFYEQFVAQKKADPLLRQQLAKAYFRIGQITREIDSLTQAMSAFRSAQGIWEPLVGANPSDRELSCNLAECFLAIGRLDSVNGNFRAALTTLGLASAILARLWRENPDEPRYQSILADCYSEIGIAHAKLGESDQSLAIHEKAKAIQQGLIGRYPENHAYKKGLAENLIAVGFAQYTQKNNTAALKTFHDVQDFCQALLKELSHGPKPPWLLNLLALSQQNIGNVHKDNGDFEKALSFFEEALKSRSDLVEQHPSVTQFREKLAVSYKEIAGLERKARQDVKALPRMRKSIEVYEGLVHSQPDNAGFRRELAWMWDEFGLVEDEARNNTAARDAFDAAVREQKAAIAKSNPADELRWVLCFYLENLGEQSIDLGRPKEGLPHYEEALKIRRELIRAHPENQAYADALIAALLGLGGIERHLGEPAAARELFAEARTALAERFGSKPADWEFQFRFAAALGNEAAALADLAQPQKARPLLDDALTRLDLLSRREAPAWKSARARDLRSETLWDLARVLRALTLPAEAERIDAERIELWKAQPPEELVDLALKHLTQANLIGYGKTPVSAPAKAVRELDSNHAASDLILAVSRGLKDLDKLSSSPESALLLSREDVKAALTELERADTPSGPRKVGKNENP